MATSGAAALEHTCSRHRLPGSWRPADPAPVFGGRPPCHADEGMRCLMVPHSVRPQVGRWQNGDATSLSPKQTRSVYLAGSDSAPLWVVGRQVLLIFFFSLRCIFYRGAYCVKRNRNRNNKRCFAKDLRYDQCSDPGWLNNTPSEQ